MEKEPKQSTLAREFNRWRIMNRLLLADAAAPVTTAATLSRFESGHSSLSGDLFGQLLIHFPVPLTVLAGEYHAAQHVPSLFETISILLSDAATARTRQQKITEAISLYQAQFDLTKIPLYRLQADAVKLVFTRPMDQSVESAVAVHYFSRVQYYSEAELQTAVFLVLIVSESDRDALLQHILLHVRLDDDRQTQVVTLITVAGVITAARHGHLGQAERWQHIAQRLGSADNTPTAVRVCLQLSRLILAWHRAPAQQGLQTAQAQALQHDLREAGAVHLSRGASLIWHYGTNNEKGCKVHDVWSAI
ncbi:hypothetical protein [Schleiferilactobacillus shenzhenensis]|uniref:HTH cro/C1-type domain-containing protein n=1 Tax=Schleiferilactobacillus shenzhenensis LY-73 TaxID=1231336 RepID=U4TTG6_9LACO|nr:hypothetical protein [Schleiferilactobacillus shenzhenensis]ERL65178.1 hypothetical protein L248_2853 [Schleiferilactobacillus shenzhenensis LY-73]